MYMKDSNKPLSEIKDGGQNQKNNTVDKHSTR